MASPIFSYQYQEELMPAKSDFKPNAVVVPIISSTLIFVVLGLFINISVRTSTSILPLQSFLENEREITISAENEYGTFSAPYPWLTSQSVFVEPYKQTTIAIQSIYDEDDELMYIWEVQTDLNSQPQTYVGKNITLQYKSTGIFSLNISAMDPKLGSLLGFYTFQAICKYVKRELRTLTYDDREKFLDAAAVIWQYSTDEGRSKYGSKFTGIDSFVAIHMNSSNDIMCDSYHEGSGFLSHHLALSNAFDASLRSIDPSVTLPYWDFTIEGQAIQDVGQVPSYFLEIAPFFNDEWFGSVSSSDYRISDSRWAYSKVPKADSTTGRGSRNSYNIQRSFWNNNPDEHVTRKMFEECGLEPTHKKIPYCGLHYDVLNSSDLGTFQILSGSDGHGPIHIQFGGMWGSCTDAYTNFTEKWGDVLSATLTDDEIAVAGTKDTRGVMFEKSVMGEYFRIYRAFWRSHMCSNGSMPALLECPDQCSETTPFEECTCTVTKLVNNEISWEDIYGCVLKDDKKAMFDAIMPRELIQDMVTFLATASIQHGDMIESSSPADILFWVVHPGIDRMMSAKRLPTVTDMGGTPFHKWDVVDGSNETWLEWSYYTFEAGTNEVYPDGNVCVGHGASDPVLSTKLPLTDAMLLAADADGDGEISNWDYFLASDPNDVYGNDYVFDNFKWDHCIGVDM